ncbi:MAG: enoyl-CoA hydratase/isomerase family protein, partial [Acetobacteraceae bacterium]|nr:enoyl-CoA hydratase/isomerase family protein [Acetobacteraceae bacterium]
MRFAAEETRMEAFARALESRKYADGRLLLAKDDGVALLTFNQPEKRNAISVAMWEAIGGVLDECREDHSVRVVILSGAGTKAFSAGADLSEFGGDREGAVPRREYEELTAAARAKLTAFPKPVIARIRGHCLGGGLAIAMHADIRIAAVDSRFGIPAARLGFVMGFDTVTRLVSLVGEAQARRLLYSAAQIDAMEAQRIGLVNRTVADEALSDAVVDLARTIADNAPLALAAAKLA